MLLHQLATLAIRTVDPSSGSVQLSISARLRMGLCSSEHFIRRSEEIMANGGRSEVATMLHGVMVVLSATFPALVEHKTRSCPRVDEIECYPTKPFQIGDRLVAGFLSCLRNCPTLVKISRKEPSSKFPASLPVFTDKVGSSRNSASFATETKRKAFGRCRLEIKTCRRFLLPKKVPFPSTKVPTGLELWESFLDVQWKDLPAVWRVQFCVDSDLFMKLSAAFP